MDNSLQIMKLNNKKFSNLGCFQEEKKSDSRDKSKKASSGEKSTM